jgi:hypothetical protein
MRRIINTVAIALAIAAAAPTFVAADSDTAAPANTTTLSTPPLVPLGSSQLDCYIINVSDRARWVSIEALNKQGEVVARWSELLAPEHEAVAISPAADGPRSCRFVVEGLGKHFRASGLVVVPNVGSVSALAAH